MTDKSDVAMRKVASSEETVNRIIALLPEDQTKLESIRPDRTSATLDMKSTETNGMAQPWPSLSVDSGQITLYVRDATVFTLNCRYVY